MNKTEHDALQAKALRQLDELIDTVKRFWPGTADLLHLQILHRDLLTDRFPL